MWSRLSCNGYLRASTTLSFKFKTLSSVSQILSVKPWVANFGTKAFYDEGRVVNRPNISQSNTFQRIQHAGFGTDSRQNGIFDFWKSAEQPPTLTEKVFDMEAQNGQVDVDNIVTSQTLEFSQGSHIEDISSSVGDETMDAIASNSDIVMQFADYGLGGGILPHKVFQDILNYMTTSLELDWIPAIAILTLFLRILTLPGMISMRRFSARSHNLFPETMKKMAAIQNASQSDNKLLYKKANMEYMSFMSKNRLNPIRALLINLPNGIIFMSMFMGIRKMCVAKLPSLTTGGALWFQNLTIPDPYFILPLCACLSMSMIIRSGGAEAEMGAAATMEGFRKLMMWLPIVSLPFFVFQPAAMFAFWVVSNSFTFTTMLLFRNNSILKFCGIPERLQHSKEVTSQMSKAMNPVEMFKKMKQNQKEREELTKKVQDYQTLIKKMQEVEKNKKN